jgi:hypothetical protein
MANGAVAYRLRDLLAWQEAHRVTTIDQAQPRGPEDSVEAGEL